MNRLDNEHRSQVIRCLCEGNSIRSTARITGVAKNTVVGLLCEMGCALRQLSPFQRSQRHREAPPMRRDLELRRSRKKNVTPEQEANGWGDVWTWTAIDADTKLCVTYYVGDRGKYSAYNFMRDAANRIVGRPQITTDAHRPYLEAMELPLERKSTMPSCTRFTALRRPTNRATVPRPASAAT